MATRLTPLLLVVAVGACGGDDTAGGDIDSGPPDAAIVIDAPVVDAASADATDAGVLSGAHSQYVIDSIVVPTSASIAVQCGLNIDGDDLGRRDNAIGQIFAALTGAGGTSPQNEMDQALADGRVLHLLDLQADSLTNDPFTTLRAFFGEDADVPANPADNFSGSEQFDLRSDSPTDAVVSGPVVGGRVDLGPGELSIEIAGFGAGTIILPLLGARVVGDITVAGISTGTIGGAITEADTDAILIPGLAANVQATVAADCTGTFPNCCTDGSTGQTLLGLFDVDKDCAVSENEVRNSNLIRSLLTPDVDLFDAAGNFNPRQDGVRDSLSIGICFTAVGAQFALP